MAFCSASLRLPFSSAFLGSVVARRRLPLRPMTSNAYCHTGRGRRVWSCLAVLLAAATRLASGANWAQVAGPKLQNVAVTNEVPFSARWGHATATLLFNRPPLCLSDISADDPSGAEYKAAAAAQADAVASGANVSKVSTVTNTLFNDKKILLIGGDDYGGDREGWNKMGGFLHNDVWETTGAQWKMRRHSRKQNIRGDQLPQIVSKIIWRQVAPDQDPPGNLTYTQWLGCAARKWYDKANPDPNGPEWGLGACDEQDDPNPPQFAPRRGHAALSFGRYVYLMGGRARELRDIPESEAVGGILNNARVRWREKVILLNDVWRTTDGEKWKLITPGCRPDSPQEDLVRKTGHRRAYCETDYDCKGASTCTNSTCVCNMWSPRERHAVVVYPPQPELPADCPDTGPENRMWVFGGFGWTHEQQCGNFTCGGGYRTFLNDVWRSTKKCTLDMITADVQRYGRPVHEGGQSECTSLIHKHGEIWIQVRFQDGSTRAPWAGRGALAALVHNGAIWILGGRGGDTRDADRNPLFNDVWSTHDVSALHWINHGNAEWSPREGHTAMALEDEDGTFTGHMYVVAGKDHTGYLQDVWKARNGTNWIDDFHNDTVQREYVNGDSPLKYLNTMNEDELTRAELAGITSIKDLATASRDQIISLRGQPDEDGWKQYYGGRFEFICPHKKRAEVVLEKCGLQKELLDGEFERSERDDWRDPSPFYGGIEKEAERDAEKDDEDCEDADGCSMCPFFKEEEEQKTEEIREFEEKEEEMFGELIKEEDGVLDLTCLYRLPPRAFHSTVYHQGRMYVIGGKAGNHLFHKDMWYRDYKPPVTTITLKPRTKTTDSKFEFQCDEAGCIYEYRLYLLDQEDDKFIELKRNWTLTLGEVDYETWMPGWGLYRFEVRAIDPAGNVDLYFVKGFNTWEWIFYPKLPIALILGIIFGVIFVVVVLYLEIRRRRKKRAMERYAIKRMRRKFKGIQKGSDKKNVDWRKFYDESKDKGGKGKKDKPKEKTLSKRK